MAQLHGLEILTAPAAAAAACAAPLLLADSLHAHHQPVQAVNCLITAAAATITNTIRFSATLALNTLLLLLPLLSLLAADRR